MNDLLRFHPSWWMSLHEHHESLARHHLRKLHWHDDFEIRALIEVITDPKSRQTLFGEVQVPRTIGLVLNNDASKIPSYMYPPRGRWWQDSVEAIESENCYSIFRYCNRTHGGTPHRSKPPNFPKEHYQVAGLWRMGSLHACARFPFLSILFPISLPPTVDPHQHMQLLFSLYVGWCTLFREVGICRNSHTHLKGWKKAFPPSGPLRYYDAGKKTTSLTMQFRWWFSHWRNFRC